MDKNPPLDDDEFDDEFSFDDSEFPEEEEHHEPAPAAPQPAAPSPKPAAAPSPAPVAPVTPAAQEPFSSIHDIPMTLTIEVGRVVLSADKLLNLQPGNLLDLKVALENGVIISVNGKKIGRGELMRIGDNIGVRILDLGKG